MEPKWSSGARFFDFLEILFSYNTTMVFLVFTGFGWSRGDQKSTKKRVGKINLKKLRFFTKSLKKYAKMKYFFAAFCLLFRTFCALGAQGCPKAPRDCPGTPKVLEKVPKRSPKGTKTEPKVLENATKNTKRNSR